MAKLGATADPPFDFAQAGSLGMTSKDQGKGKSLVLADGLHPTLCDGTAKDGAPERCGCLFGVDRRRDRIEVEEGAGMECTHLNQIRKVKPSAKGCEDCLKIGSTWVHLRMCMECGHMGCCDSSPNKHATKHFHATKHPIMRSMEPREDWGWCYIDEVELDFS